MALPNWMRVSRTNWQDFNGVDCPTWMSEAQANLVCCFLNAYIPLEYGRIGTRYHVLNRYQGGLFIHLINAPREAQCR